MILKKIEIHGFKSFAEKTEFELGGGVTCLVGPNGCGKSNVVDAVKWALGEQRASALRGDQMGDVIFKGNGNRPPMSFAEVTLVFDNETQKLPIDSTEVSISRRLYRTGDSEYLVNRTVCRLKDVRELFYDTGLGQNSYAVLEQGRIDAVLHANPQDRRSVFEEAAGIHRFLVRKREAARKLEKVDQNLLRVTDLIEELEKRVRSLRIQAGRARSYVQLSDRLTELKTIQFLSAGAELIANSSALTADLLRSKEEDQATEADLESSSKRVEEVDGEANVLRESLSRSKNRLVELKADHRNAGEKRTSLELRVSESKKEAETRVEEIARVNSEVGRQRSEMVRQQKELESHSAELSRGRADVGEKRALVQAAQQESESRGGRLARIEDEIASLAGQELAGSNELASLESHLRSLRVSRERLVRREVELTGHVERVSSDASRLEQELSRLGAESEERSRSIEDCRTSLERCRKLETELRDQNGEAQSNLDRAGSKRETLDGVIESMEGVDEGSRRLVQASRSGVPDLDGVMGLLGELLSVPRDRARAVDAALGQLAGAVVVKDRKVLEASLKYVREKGGGRTILLALDSAPFRSSGDRKAGAGEPLLDGIETRADLDQLVDSLVGETRLVAGEGELLSQIGTGQFVVTVEGARLDSSGAFTTPPGVRMVGLVERKVERDRLARQEKELRSGISDLEEQIARIGVEATGLEALVGEAEHAKGEIEDGIVKTRSEGQRLRDRSAIFRRELKVSAGERQDLEVEERSVRSKRSLICGELGAHSSERERLEGERKEVNTLRETDKETIEKLQSEEAIVAQLTVRLEERVRGLENERNVVSRVIDEHSRNVVRLDGERAALVTRAEEAEQTIAGLVSGMDSQLEEQANVRSRVEEIEEQVRRSADVSKAAREAAMTASEARDGAREALHQFELQEREVSMNLSALRERARDEISLDIDERLKSYDATSGPPLEEVNQELSQVRGKISRIGNVNLDAINELEDVEKRSEFLSRESSDLDESRKSLIAAIEELDQISRDRFLATFDAVKDHFKALFRKLFHGGKADVRLEEGVDVLEAGIEISAGPPGKDPRSITLLSGGERTMTAVALLFALFKAKPSPVAILDEVDAALDEANTERFCHMLDDFIKTSQFLIVTHAKQTMSYSDVMYGVTMEENGVSKKIGIRLDEYEEQVA